MTRAIVVGTDGTDYSSIAVDWAAHEARRRRLPLRIVHAYDWDWQQARFSVGNAYVEMARTFAEGVVAGALDRARQIAPSIEITTDTMIGNAVPRLLEAAAGAELLVVGGRGRGGFTGLLLGSVSQQMATHAPCPVVVVRGHASVTGRPIVAGVDDSPAAEHVLETAFTMAAEEDADLTVVRAYLPVIPLWIAGVAPATLDMPEQDADEQKALDEQLAPWRAKFPEVRVRTTVTHESAAFTLVEASRKARLVIVGSRGHGVLAGSLIGSTGLQLLHHAIAPVYVVRPQPA
ncbi:universal stress protein [Actinoplanes sp. NPDC051851]|uniref:universal stress protein n=1 Tax=Actinoplanes sp. NPDC051851 TaxID=3154753 RepID=UPI00344A4808